MNLNDLYKKVSAIPIGDFPPSALSGLLHGYISVYSIVRVSPWLEDVYGSQWDIHERIREIAGELADLIQDPSVTLEDRVGHIADLMGAYLTYSDMDFLDIALDAAYGIISPEGRDEIVLPCRTPEMCRLLCSCYYFMGEEECARLAGEIIEGKEQLFVTLGYDYDLLEIVHRWRWRRAIEFYENSVTEEKKMGFDVTDLFDKISQLLIDNSERDDYMLLTTVFDLLTAHECVKERC